MPTQSLAVPGRLSSIKTDGAGLEMGLDATRQRRSPMECDDSYPWYAVAISRRKIPARIGLSLFISVMYIHCNGSRGALVHECSALRLYLTHTRANRIGLDKFSRFECKNSERKQIWVEVSRCQTIRVSQEEICRLAGNRHQRHTAETSWSRGSSTNRSHALPDARD